LIEFFKIILNPKILFYFFAFMIFGILQTGFYDWTIYYVDTVYDLKLYNISHNITNGQILNITSIDQNQYSYMFGEALSVLLLPITFPIIVLTLFIFFYFYDFIFILSSTGTPHIIF
jgi:hypothetical protein